MNNNQQPEEQQKEEIPVLQPNDSQQCNLDSALQGFEDELNVTADEKSQADDKETDPQIQKEYEEFMKSMQSGNQQQGFEQIGKMMQNLMGEFDQNNKQPNSEGLPNEMGDMFNNFENNPQFDDLANHLLQEFMDKDVLEEPLIDSKQKYAEFLKENKDKISNEEYERYEKQAKCIDQILEIIQKDPNNKDKMIEKFEEMQEYGQPPLPLLNAFGGESPFEMFNQLGQQNKQQGGDDNQNKDCNIF